MRRGRPLERSRLCIMIGCYLPSFGSQAIGGAMKDEVTSILSAVEQGDSRAAERLLPLIYDELRALARESWRRRNRVRRSGHRAGP